MTEALTRLRERPAAALAVLVGIFVLIAVFRLPAGATAADESVVAAKRGDLVVTVGGVGRIVEARASGSVVLAASGGSSSASSSSGSSSGSASNAPANPNAVFPRASGRLSKYLVQPGQRVKAGQAIALVDDGQAAAANLAQAQSDVATARLELYQKRTSDPLRGIRATPAELAAGRLAVTSAQKRLKRLLAGPRRAEVAAARLDVRRAQADLETLRRGSARQRSTALRIAERNAQLARERLESVSGPADRAAVATAEADLKRAESALAALTQGPPQAAIEALKARISAADMKRRTAQSEFEAYTAAQEHAQAVQELATLTRPPAAHEIAAATAAVEAARRNLEKVTAPPSRELITAAQLEVERAEAEVAALKEGAGPAAIAAGRQSIVSAKARLAQLTGPPLDSDLALARFELARARADLAVLQGRGGPGSPTDVEFARLRLAAANAKLASARLSHQLLSVTAPTSGTVTALHAATGAPVDPTTPLVSIAGLDRLAVVVDLSEFDVAQVRPGMEATVSVDALGGEEFEGEVQFASLTGNEVNGVVTFPVVIRLPKAEGLRPGMNVTVNIIVTERKNVVQLPLEAVTTDEEDKAFATVMGGDGETVVRPLKLGVASNTHVEVLKGVKVGEKVVLAEPAGGGEE